MFISDSFFVRNTCQVLQQKVINNEWRGGEESNFDVGIVTRRCISLVDAIRSHCYTNTSKRQLI